jgi:acetyl esterase/lipase
MNEKRPFYELPLAYPAGENQTVEVRRDIPYLDAADSAALMDIYLPQGPVPEGGFAPLLFLHGGPLPPSGERPWPKEWRVFQDYGRLAAAGGLAGVVMNHRYFGYEGLIQAGGDVRQAVDFLARNGAEFGLDGRRLAVWAFSGAAMLLSPLLAAESARLRGLIAFYPMLDLTHIPQAAGLYSEAELIALSPLSQIEEIPPALPIFLVRAGLDRAGLNRALDTFVKQALYHNLNLEVRNLPQAGHSFDMFETSPAVQAAIESGLNFAQTHLRD